jgi:hypothetical protein
LDRGEERRQRLASADGRRQVSKFHVESRQLRAARFVVALRLLARLPLPNRTSWTGRIARSIAYPAGRPNRPS